MFPKALSLNAKVEKENLRLNFREKLIPSFALRKIFSNTKLSNKRENTKFLLAIKLFYLSPVFYAGIWSKEQSHICNTHVYT